MGIEESIQEKIDTLLLYREALDDTEREVFDLLIGYANEVAIAIDRGGVRFDEQLC